MSLINCQACGETHDQDRTCARPSLAERTGSADWDRTWVENTVANCRQQIQRLRMRMPTNVALAIGAADRELADAQAWLRLLPPNASASATGEQNQKDNHE